MIRIKLPCLLEYRDLAMRLVTAACKLVENRKDGAGRAATPPSRVWADQVISAFGEAFNNVVLHAYDRDPGDLEIEIDPGADRLVIRVMDYGKSFDMDAVPAPDLDDLPESGLGIFIIRSCMDDVSYQGGSPNVLSMTKYLGPSSTSSR